ncbi:substrate-binding domain-containing protein [Hydrogenoanaerobacterium sp.]|uniref:substrate-binding domain-containing protein n=1 Tax=Hydrogenoanaerobacterium sp. TaxID=2953763 RepID=UPI0028A0BEC6|nr:substrate-binding domain-containing protein [Hydrogenoanaerobacterium sp.]
MIRRILAILWAMLIVFTLASCSTVKKEYQVDLIVKSTNSDFWDSVYDGAKAAGAKYNINLRFLGPDEEKNYRNQVRIIEQSVTRKPDAIILAAADYAMMAEPMESVVDAGIPVIMLDSAVDSDRWKSFVSTDNIKAGAVLAAEVAERVKTSDAKIGVVSFVKNSSPSKERYAGFTDYITQNTDMSIVNTVYCDSDIDLAKELTLEMIKNYPDMTVIAGLNAQAATGAARALAELGREDVFLAAIDCTVEQAEYMEENILKVAVLQNPYLMGYFSVQATYKILKNERVERNIDTAVCVVDKENMFSEEVQQLIFPFY